MDYQDAQQEYNLAILENSNAKKDWQRRQFLKDNPTEVKSAADKKLVAKSVTEYHTIWQDKKKTRRSTKTELDEAKKALETHKDEEEKGFIRENDIVKMGSQYKANWTHLPA